MSQIDQVLAQADASFDADVTRWLDWLRIPSISANPAHDADCLTAAEFAAAALRAMGFSVEIMATKGQPVVVAHHAGPASGAPHLLYYGHYDVQPADPLELWTSPPFEPQIVDGPHGRRVVARGAVDDKGQVATWLAAFRAWFDTTGSMPAQITVMLEGEEEIGSPNLEPFIVANRARFAQAEIAVISDTNQWDIDTPALTTSVRGMVYLEVLLKAATRDLHSGMAAARSTRSTHSPQRWASCTTKPGACASTDSMMGCRTRRTRRRRCGRGWASASMIIWVKSA